VVIKEGGRMKISWIILTHNRFDTVRRSFHHNYINSGHPVDEIIWCDNGSNQDKNDMPLPLKEADVKIFNKENLGVAKGYNRAISMSTGTHIVITGCDRLMPENWLKTWVEHFKDIPKTGVISCYSYPLKEVPERGGLLYFMNDKPVNEVIPMEAKIFSRQLHNTIGYLREDFGLYGWEDVEWGYRAHRVTNELGLTNYIVNGMISKHLGSEGVKNWNGEDSKEYHEFKKKESQDPKKKELLEKCKKENWPYYNPYL
jgi:GT2 family glycosyltransferase